MAQVFPELESDRTFVYTSAPNLHSLPLVNVSHVFFLKEEYQTGYGYVPISIHQSEISKATIKKFPENCGFDTVH